MAKATKATSKAAPKTTSKAKAPAGYVDKAASESVGTWDYEGGEPIHFIPRSVVLLDSKFDKFAAIIAGELVEPCNALTKSTKDEEGELHDIAVEGKPGDLVSVFYRVGMKGVHLCGGLKTWMVKAGEIDVGKGNPMTTFDVQSEPGKQGHRIPVVEDRRKRTANHPTPFDVPSRRSHDDSDDVPF